MGATAITVASGSTLAPNYGLNNPTTTINIGTASAGARASVTLSAGSFLNMTDGTGTIKTFNINSLGAAAANPALTSNGTSASPVNMYFDIGGLANQIDTLNVVGRALFPNAGGTLINIVPFLTDTSLTPGSYLFITGSSGSTLGTSNLTLASTSLTVGGITYGLSLSGPVNPSTSTDEYLTITAAGTVTPIYWYGGRGDNLWNSNTGMGTGTNSTNWSSSSSGSPDAGTIPTAGSDVFFSASSVGAATVNTTLGQNFTINSLNVLGGTGPTTITGGSGNGIGGGAALTINAGSGNGITLASTAGATTINAVVVLGGNQTWTNNSSNLLTVNGQINGAFSLITAGSGTIALNGASTYSGGTTITSGTVLLGAPNPNPASPTSVTPLGSSTALVTLQTGTTGLLFASGTANLQVVNPLAVSSGTATLGTSATTGAADVFNGSITLSTGVTLQAATGGSVTFSGAWTTNNNIITIGSSGNTGSVTLTTAVSSPTAAPGVAVNFGTLVLNSALTGSDTVASGATLSGNGSVSGTTGVGLTGLGGGTVNGSALVLTGVTTFNGSGNTLTGTVTSINGVSLANNATLNLTGALTGNMTVGNGTLTGTGSVSGTTGVTGGTINGTGLVLTGATTFNSSGNTLSGTVTSTNGVSLADLNTALQFSGTLTGNLAVGAGTLSGSGTVSGNATLAGGTMNYFGNITGTLGISGTGAPGTARGASAAWSPPPAARLISAAART